MPLDPECNEVAITYYLLQPKDSASEPEPLKIGELVIIYAQRVWKTAKITNDVQTERRTTCVDLTT